VLSLPAGTYVVQARAPFCAITASNLMFSQAKLRDTTNGVDLVVGASSKVVTNATAENQADAWVIGAFTLAGTANVELQQWSDTAAQSGGRKVAAPGSLASVYSTVYLQKVA
jgi:hypothetical protein